MSSPSTALDPASEKGRGSGERGGPLLTRAQAAVGFAVFALLGALQAMYGPSIPSLRADFHLSAPDAGLLLSAQFWGAVMGVAAYSAGSRFLSAAWRQGVAMGCVAAGCALLGFAPAWLVALPAALFIGFGSGGLIVALNTAFAAGFGRRSPAMVNLLNAAYGAGAVLGPVGVALAPANSFRPVFLAAGVPAVLLLLPAYRLPQIAAVHMEVSWPRGRRAIVVLALFLLAFLLYDGLEGDIGGWAATQLKYHGLSGAAAANITAVFWGTLTLGRIVLAPVAQHFPPQRLLTVLLLAVLAVMLAAQRPALTPAAYTVAGFLLAPIFPVLFVWVQRTYPHVRSAASLVLLAALSGGAAFPPLVGKLIGATSPDVLPTFLLVVACLELLAVGAVQRGARGIRSRAG